MKPLDIVLIIGCVAVVLGVAIAAIIRKKKGKSSCGGDCGCCGACSACSACKYMQKDNKKK